MSSGTAQDGGSATNLKTLLQLLQTPEVEADTDDGRPDRRQSKPPSTANDSRFSPSPLGRKDGPLCPNSPPQFRRTSETTQTTYSGDRSASALHQDKHAHNRDPTHRPRRQKSSNGALPFPYMPQPGPQGHHNQFLQSPQHVQLRCNSEPPVDHPDVPFTAVSHQPPHLPNQLVPQSAGHGVPMSTQHQPLVRQTRSADPSAAAEASIRNLQLVQSAPYVMPPRQAQQYADPPRCHSVSSANPSLGQVPELKDSCSQHEPSLSSPVALIVRTQPPLTSGMHHAAVKPSHASHTHLLNDTYSNMMDPSLTKEYPALDTPASDKASGAVTMQAMQKADLLNTTGRIQVNRRDAEIHAATFTSSSIPMMLYNSFMKHGRASGGEQLDPRPIMMPACHAYASPEPRHPDAIESQPRDVPSSVACPPSGLEDGFLNASFGQNPPWPSDPLTGNQHLTPGARKRSRDVAGNHFVQNHGTQNHMGMHAMLADPSVQDISDHYRRLGGDQESVRGRSSSLGGSMPHPPLPNGKVSDAAMHEANAYMNALQRSTQISQPLSAQPASDRMLGDMSGDPTEDQIALAQGAHRALSCMGLMNDTPQGLTGTSSLQTNAVVLDPVGSFLPPPGPVSLASPNGNALTAPLTGEGSMTVACEGYNARVNEMPRTSDMPPPTAAHAPPQKPLQGCISLATHPQVPVKSVQEIFAILRNSVAFGKYPRMVLIPGFELENGPGMRESYVSHVYRAKELTGYFYTIQEKN